MAAASATDAAFAGSIPALYDRYLGPLQFQPYAELVAERARSLQPKRILETAAGTGVVTAALHRALPEAEIVATDLNPPMLEIAEQRLQSPNVRFESADAQALPFPDDRFDLVVCQFGIMFFPDKIRATAEARRVLRREGSYLLVIWNQIERNLASLTATQAVASLFPNDAARFLERTAYAYADPALIEHDLRAAGFTDIELETVERRSRLGSAREAAIGFCQGSLLRLLIEEQGPGALERATDAATEALRQFEGPDGFDAPMSAHVVTATK